MKRVFLIVLDSCGAGAMPDSESFGDVGVHTLKSCAVSENLNNSEYGIDTYLFCSVTDTVSDTVTSIGNYAFSGYSNLDVTIDNSKDNITLGYDVFAVNV